MTTMSFRQLGWRTLWRDARAGELRLLWVAVTLAVAALTSVAFFANRLEMSLERDARQLLGGDVWWPAKMATCKALRSRQSKRDCAM